MVPVSNSQKEKAINVYPIEVSTDEEESKSNIDLRDFVEGDDDKNEENEGEKGDDTLKSTGMVDLSTASITQQYRGSVTPGGSYRDTMKPWNEKDAREAKIRQRRRSERRQKHAIVTSTALSSASSSLLRLNKTEQSTRYSSSSNNNNDGGEDDTATGNHAFSNWFTEKWTFDRLRHTGMFCISSCAVLGIRLWLDNTPSAYLIHSIIVFFDMILIHLFTHSVWLSISGELLTVLAVVAFTLTKQTVFELLETTIIAILCSFHLILSRNKHMDRQEELETGVEYLRETVVDLINDEEQSFATMRQIHQQTCMLLHDMEQLESEHHMQCHHNHHYHRQHRHQPHNRTSSILKLSNRRRSSFLKSKDEAIISNEDQDVEGNCNCENKDSYDADVEGFPDAAVVDLKRKQLQEEQTIRSSFFLPPKEYFIATPSVQPTITVVKARTSATSQEHSSLQDSNIHQQRLRICGEHFFEHFLDGSAGVMYTSFLGLILDEFVSMATRSDKGCY